MKKFLAGLLTKIETHIIFYPMREFFDEMLPELKDIMEEVFFENEDEILLNAWYASPKEGKPVVLYCHGMAEHIAFMQDPYKVLTDNGYGVFAPEYRGHGKSDGKPSECGIYSDVAFAVEFLKKEKGLREEDIVIWGRSMGGAVAVDVATKYNFRAVVMESTFTTIKEASEYILRSGCDHPVFTPKRKIFFRLANLFPRKQLFSTIDKIHKIKSPIFICHSKNDDIVDYRMAETNAQKHGAAELFIYEGEDGSHNHSDWAYDKVLGFLDGVCEAKISNS